jgi:hypothetical protein
VNCHLFNMSEMGLDSNTLDVLDMHEGLMSEVYILPLLFPLFVLDEPTVLELPFPFTFPTAERMPPTYETRSGSLLTFLPMEIPELPLPRPLPFKKSFPDAFPSRLPSPCFISDQKSGLYGNTYISIAIVLVVISCGVS